MAAGIETGANSSMLLERNTVNPTSRLRVEAGVIARCAVEVRDRGSWRKQTPFVMERIGAATSSRRANGQTSSGSFVTRQRAEPSREEIANERGFIHVCILRQDDTGEPVEGFKCACPVSGRQVHIVKVTRGIPALTGPAYVGLCTGLSRMRGNHHVRFLGEGVAATSPPYPTARFLA